VLSNIVGVDKCMLDNVRADGRMPDDVGVDECMPNDVGAFTQSKL